MATVTIAPADLVEGSAVTARWGAWVIGIRSVDRAWHVRVWSWAHGARVQIGKRAVLSTATEAVSWACSVLRAHGAVAFVDGRVQPLERFLAFSPAPTRTL